MKVDFKKHLDEHIFVRKNKSYSFGSIDILRPKFEEVFCLVDETVNEINEYQHLPEYDEVIKWMSNTQGKGLLLAGSNGRGKSVIINSLLPLFFKAMYGKRLTPIPARELSKIENLPFFIVIDEIGQEEIQNKYGTKIDHVELAISKAEDQNRLLILSTNLNSKQLLERYGTRILDRIYRLCNIIPFKGKSLRK